ncbi:hypothetical protein IFR04_008041 [Cadophora malorum]|uniref:Uncharacterized protein n=1 Tax=Cadophora malorum TaxID=108018 RepID=A0A8H7TH63_9HELO|nr:hypothetical protein IFR04_008041 [Cadophora malorum]
MPRPKRTKIAPSVPAPRVKKSAKTSPPVAALPIPPRVPFDDLYDVSDAEDAVAASTRGAKGNKGKGKAVAASSSQEIGQGLESRDSVGRDGETLEKRLESDRISQEDPAEESSLPNINLDSSSPSIETGRNEHRTPGIESSMLAIGNFKRRPRQPSILGRGPGRARSSSIDSNMAEDNGLTSVGRNTSAIGIGNFKRRPRERSIMGRNAAHVAPSSKALEMERGTPANVGSAMKIGTFKRREREPSILQTAQKVRQEEPLDFDDEEDDFNPDDESTPLNLSKTRNMTSSSGGPSSSSSRKRKLSAIQVPRSSPSLPSPRADEAEETIPATNPRSDEQGEEEEEALESSPRLLPSIEARPDTPEPLSETMAPPQSSSPLPSSPDLPPRPRRAPSRGRRPLRGRTPPPRTQDSPISSPPSLTHSPNRPVHATARKPQRQAPPPSTFSTAQLQALLPRRRQRAIARDPFDVPSSGDEVDVSGLAPDDDELSHLNVQARSRRHTSVRARTPAPLKRGRKVNRPVSKPKDSNVKRTYGSRANAMSDKENTVEVDPDDSLAPIPDGEANDDPENSQELEERVGKELKQAAKKFQEVDKWELEFEEVTASSSSPRDGR